MQNIATAGVVNLHAWTGAFMLACMHQPGLWCCSYSRLLVGFCAFESKTQEQNTWHPMPMIACLLLSMRASSFLQTFLLPDVWVAAAANRGSCCRTAFLWLQQASSGCHGHVSVHTPCVPASQPAVPLGSRKTCGSCPLLLLSALLSP